jgi:hypothetical protein
LSSLLSSLSSLLRQLLCLLLGPKGELSHPANLFLLQMALMVVWLH